MSDTGLLNEHQRAVANALTEWRDAGASVEDVVFTIEQMFINDMKKVLYYKKEMAKELNPNEQESG